MGAWVRAPPWRPGPERWGLSAAAQERYQHGEGADVDAEGAEGYLRRVRPGRRQPYDDPRADPEDGADTREQQCEQDVALEPQPQLRGLGPLLGRREGVGEGEGFGGLRSRGGAAGGYRGHGWFPF
ncbi:hypothetical protein ACFW6V_04705 [Streptomyces sp. NPDC058734]|uniref:hypothetical protein n=1 Tax=Streptomyces sp. NPDC058734 TaxID=3346615 RepID=UPI0036B04263